MGSVSVLYHRPSLVLLVLLNARRAMVWSDLYGEKVKPYFSQKEFAAFVAGTSGQVKLTWVALSGDLLNEKEAAELERLLDEFFRKRGHRSFRKDHPTQQQQQPSGAPMTPSSKHSIAPVHE